MNHDEENRACDKNMLIGGNIKCTCGKTVLHNYSEGEMQNPAQKEEKIMEQWEVDFNAKFLFAGDRTGSKLKDFIRTQIALAEQRGRDAQQKEDYEVAKAQQEKAFKSGAEMGEERGRSEVITENTSDGYHTFKELYEFRKMFNAALFNEWAKQGKYSVHKSMRHGDGELAFGGGWFIVMATLPTGQISNHYEMKDYALFECKEREKADVWDGHTANDVLQRLSTLTQKL